MECFVCACYTLTISVMLFHSMKLEDLADKVILVPSKIVEVIEFDNLHVACKVNVVSVENWHVVIRLSMKPGSLIGVSSLDPTLCNHNISTFKSIGLEFKISCDVAKSNIELVIFNASSKLHDVDIRCILKTSKTTYQKSTRIFVQVAATFEVHIHPRNEVVVQEYQDLEVECKLDQRIRTDRSLNWNVIWDLSGVSLISFGSFEPRFCSHYPITDNRTKTMYITSCSKRTNSIKLKLYRVSSTKHGAEIGCGLRIHEEIYKDTTTIYVQVPVKAVTISNIQNRLKPGGGQLFLVECKTSPSRPAAEIQWSILRPENEDQIPLIESSVTKDLDNESGLWSTKSYLNFSTDCKESYQTIVCEALDSSADVNPLDITCENNSKIGNPSMELDGSEIISLRLFNTTCTNSTNDTSPNIAWLQKGLKEDFGFPAGHFTYVQTLHGQTTNMCLIIDYDTTQNLITDTIIQFLQNNWPMITASLLLASLVSFLVGCFLYRRLRQWRTLATSQNIQMQLLQEIIRQYMEINPTIYENNCRVAELNAELPYNNLLPPTENPYCNSE